MVNLENHKSTILWNESQNSKMSTVSDSPTSLMEFRNQQTQENVFSARYLESFYLHTLDEGKNRSLQEALTIYWSS